MKVVGHRACSDATAEVDPWIPMKVSWSPRSTADLLYLRISGRSGGEVEFKVDLETGMLTSAIVLVAPPASEALVPSGYEKISEGAVPVLDLGIWRQRDADRLRHGSVVEIQEDLGFVADGQEIRLRFGGRKPSSIIQCGPVRVGVSDHGDLAEIGAAVDIHP